MDRFNRKEAAPKSRAQKPPLMSVLVAVVYSVFAVQRGRFTDFDRGQRLTRYRVAKRRIHPAVLGAAPRSLT
jgi:hypothetical protein